MTKNTNKAHNIVKEKIKQMSELGIRLLITDINDDSNNLFTTCRSGDYIYSPNVIDLYSIDSKETKALIELFESIIQFRQTLNQ